MSIAILTDFHLHNFKRFATITSGGLNSRLAEQVSVLMGTVKWIADHRPTHLFFLGDLYHSMGSALDRDVIRAGYLIFEKIQKLGIQTMLIPGNHDLVRGKTTFRIFNNLPNLYTILTPTVMAIENHKVGFVPYCRTLDEFKKSLGKVKEANILCCHQVFSGAAVGAMEFRLKDVFPLELVSQFDLVLSGHVHKHQIVGNVVYPGAIYAMDFGDVNSEKGFCLLDGLDVTFIPVAGPRFEIVKLETEKDRKRFLTSYDKSTYYRVHVGALIEVEGLPIAHNVEYIIERKKVTEERVKVNDKSQEDIIKEAAKVMFPSEDHEWLCDEALKLWREIE